MTFLVQVRRDVSLSQLAQLAADGVSVTKTPHVGNVYPNNLALLANGIPMMFLDRTLGEKDRNFHPHGIIVGGSFTKVAREDVLLTHLRADVPHAVFGDLHAPGVSVAEAHMEALRRAIPQGTFERETDFFVRHADDPVCLLALEAFSRIMPQEHKFWWRRFVHSDGSVEIRPDVQWKEIASQEIFGLTHHECGWLTPNVLNIFLDGVLRAKEIGTDEVYHLSGPDMVTYIDEMRTYLDALYCEVVRYCRGLPKVLKFNLVPVADMRFAVPRSRAARLDRLVEGWLSLQRFNNVEASERIRCHKGARAAAIAEVLSVRKGLLEELSEALAACPDVLYDIREARYVSQYDVLIGSGLYVHPWGLSASIVELSLCIKTLRKIAERGAGTGM